MLIPPAGIALAWLSGWKRTTKILATVLATLWFLVPALGDPQRGPKTDAKAQPAVTGAATTSPTASAPASPPPPSPTSASKAVMPKVVGRPYASAERAVEGLGVHELTAASAYDDVKLPADHANWTVCFQGPDPGAPLTAGNADPNVHLVAPGTGCPVRLHTDLHPKPTRPVPPPPADETRDADRSGGGNAVGTVSPGAFCSPAGGTGVSKKGVVYTCKGPGQDRWRR
ncbi:hypothetical protein [Streptomyces sp. NPDC094032]|uniref:hypothetical protein n=1 Tax=Streptomyces sp. NPDC094032 TaxID=3155308 RepID=UPI0033174998